MTRQLVKQKNLQRRSDIPPVKFQKTRKSNNRTKVDPFFGNTKPTGKDWQWDWLPLGAWVVNGELDNDFWEWLAQEWMHEMKCPTDLLQVIAFLEDNDLFKRVGGRNKLTTLLDRCVSAVNIDALAHLFREKYLRRKLIALGSKITELGYDFTQDLESCIEQAQREMFDFAVQRYSSDRNELIKLGDVANDLYQQVEQQAQTGESPGLLTGFYNFDAMTGGLEGDQLFIVAGRPSMDKSAWAQDVGWNIATTYQQQPVSFFARDEPSTTSKADGSEISSNRNFNFTEWEAFSSLMGSFSRLFE